MIDSAKKPPENRIHLFDPVGLITDSYVSHAIRPARRPTRSHDGGSPLRFAVETKSPDNDGESDSPSPRLWNTSTSNSPAPKPPQSPDSRAQAIARGRREMMEMIKDLPESSYELSLRDIVEKKSPAPRPEDSKEKKQRTTNERKKVSKKKMARSRSIDNGGFLLKTSVFPVSFWLKTKNKKKKLGASGSVKGPTKPPLHAPPKIKPGASSESESGGGFSSNDGSGSSSRSSSNASNSINREAQSNRFLPGCFSFKAKK